MSERHRIRLPAGAVPVVELGQEVAPDTPLAMRRPPGAPTAVPVAAALRRPPTDVRRFLVTAPGSRVDEGATLGETPAGRRVAAPAAGLVLGYDEVAGSVLFAAFGDEEPIVGHVRGVVAAVDDRGIEMEVPGAVLAGVDGIGEAVHGELRVAVHEAGEELRASAIDAGTRDRIIVGGSRASAETLIRARAMGAAGIVLGGILEKELRDFESIQRRRRELGGEGGAFSVLVLEGFGKVALDPAVFGWLRAHDGRMAGLFGADRRLFVYEAAATPRRRPSPRAGQRVVAHRRPFAGRAGSLAEVLPGMYAAASGVAAVSGLVRFDDGRVAVVPLANLEAVLESDDTD